MASASQYFTQQTRWRPLEIAFWLATLLPFVLAPNYLSLASQVAITALFALSLANGVKYDPTWYQSAAKSIASGMSLAEDWETQIREQAASKFPIFAEQIRTGVNVSDLMSPYKNLMAEEWEINPADILLDDPTLLSSLMTDEKGQQSQMNMGEFTRMLRKDPRWMETDKAQNKVSSMAAGVMQMFGLTG